MTMHDPLDVEESINRHNLLLKSRGKWDKYVFPNRYDKDPDVVTLNHNKFKRYVLVFESKKAGTQKVDKNTQFKLMRCGIQTGIAKHPTYLYPIETIQHYNAIYINDRQFVVGQLYKYDDVLRIQYTCVSKKLDHDVRYNNDTETFITRMTYIILDDEREFVGKIEIDLGITEEEDK